MSNDSDKDGYAVDQVEKARTAMSDEVEEYSDRKARKIVHRIDRRLLVTIGFMYCVSLIDRTNVSAAAIAGLANDLVLTGNRYVSSSLSWFTWALF